MAVTDAEKYGATADHDAVSTETAGARLDDDARDKLADSIEGSLATLGDDSAVTPSKQVESEEIEEETEEVAEEEVEEESADDSEEETEEETEEVDDSADDEKADDDKSKEESKPTLPESYRRSLKAYGWEDEEIDAAIADNVEQFTLTAMKIHRTRNDEISKFAEAGRRLRQGADQGSRPEPEKTPVGLKAIDTDALIEKYGNEEIVLAMATPMNAAIAEMQALMPEVRASVASAKRTQQETLGKAIDTFFEGKEMAPYEGLYGKPGTARTPEQTEKFNGVLELADAIVAGAAEQGRRIAFDDAMESAHADISKGYTEKAVRSEIKKTTKKRSKSLSLKPSHGGKTKKSSDKPNTRKQLETKTSAALAKVFT